MKKVFKKKKSVAEVEVKTAMTDGVDTEKGDMKKTKEELADNLLLILDTATYLELSMLKLLVPSC
jgi:NTP pyrophosphatase (non-canonical NTP hydrolase)